MPSRQEAAQRLIDKGLHSIKQGIRIQVRLEMAEELERIRQEASLVRAAADQMGSLADDVERAAGAEVVMLLASAEPVTEEEDCRP
jgi:hypothetical protein